MRNKIERDKDKKELKYLCGYCGHKFTQLVGTFNKVSSQVVCPACGNFLKTF